MTDYVHVAVAVIHHPGDRDKRPSGNSTRVLLAKRGEHQHQGGRWEFPGGKVENGEGVLAALDRELQEELGIALKSAPKPLICITHDYGDKHVILDVWDVFDYQGVPEGKEGQPLEWVPINCLHEREFPAANVPIVKACQLPNEIAITPEFRSLSLASEHLELLRGKGCPLIIFRQTQLELKEYCEWARHLMTVLDGFDAHLILHGEPEALEHLQPFGIHMSSAIGSKLQSTIQERPYLTSMSCHCESELALADALGADFVLLSPVKTTRSHPEAQVLGWERFKALASVAKMPVYALGGMCRRDVETARDCGAQGVAGISGWIPFGQ